MAEFLLVITIAICVYTDLKSRLIYNWVVIPAAVGGIALNCWSTGLAGLSHSLLGILAGVGLLLIPFLLGGMGAGDVKLLGAVGAIKGAPFVLTVFIAAALVGGVISLAAAIRNRSLRATIPYGPAIGIGAVFSLLICFLPR
ncbi:MAG: prepilin peptidase [Firmicutes bacterium]|nr:prepilin peptidase [Bacillota bacterium]